MKKIFSFFAALLLAGNMLAANFDVKHVRAVYATSENEWLFFMFETKPAAWNDFPYPYVYIDVPAKSETAIAGTYTLAEPEDAEYDYEEGEFIYADVVSDLVVTFIEKGLYHFSFNFTDMNGTEYVIDKDIPTEAVQNMGDPFDLTDALENTGAAQKVSKRMENGQLIILKNGRTFNALGAEIK